MLLARMDMLIISSKITWDIVKDDVLKVVGSFFTSSKLLSEVNSTLITLVPKVPDPSKMGEFRPISCCNIVYKYITKILANQLKLCLADVIGPIKLDLMKAYDLVDL